MEDEKGFYADFVCKQAFFMGTDAEFDKNLSGLLEGIRSKVVEARTQAAQSRDFPVIMKDCRLTGFGWK